MNGMLDIIKSDKTPVTIRNNILQLSDAPDIVIEGDGDKYIGYEHIGGAYSGTQKYVIEERDELFADYIAEMTGNGVFLDLACGDGCLTVPCAKHGIKIIAGDISNTMMSILQERARQNGILLDNVLLCRINALDLPLKDNSIDCVVANSVLHLISNPQKVLDEIYRILKPGGKFICRDDAPGKKDEPDAEHEKDNQMYFQIVNEIYSSYWKELGVLGITAKKYSWKFDRDTACRNMFKSAETEFIKRSTPYFNRLVDMFLPRFLGRGFSDQSGVPDDLHKAVCERIISVTRNKYGELFDTVGYHGFENDILITCYIK
ncbi:MAG: class I SAM-dependent methyltransferase [Clostridia bacterium]|nr:class I SAM-dependent methyltransferase [Clostridia bacterium]